MTSDPPKYSNSNSPNLCFSLLKGDKKKNLFVENIFWTNENVFLSPFNKQKQRFGELEFEYLETLMSWTSYLLAIGMSKKIGLKLVIIWTKQLFFPWHSLILSSLVHYNSIKRDEKWAWPCENWFKAFVKVW